jgi:tripartite-type tricarboxylate transporter receptor subunit TctC
MKTISRRAVLAAAALPWAAISQPEGGKPLLLVVGAGPGSAPDARARWLADKLAAIIQRPVVVDARPAGAGNLAAAAVARAAADGNTLLFAHQGLLAINPHLFAHPGFDALVDFAPIARLGIGSLVLVAGPQTLVRNLADLVQLAKTKPGQLSYCSPAIGSPPYLATELMCSMAGIELLHIPMGQLTVQQLIGGHVAFAMDSAVVMLPHIQSGRLRALAVTGRKRLASLPDVPTLDEAGLPGYQYEAWMGVVAPAGTLGSTVQRLNREISGILNTDEARAWFAMQGAEPGDQSVETFTAFVRDEHAKAGRLIRQLNLRIE